VYRHRPDDGGSTHCETPVHFVKTTRRFIPGNCHHARRRENLKSHGAYDYFRLTFLKANAHDSYKFMTDCVQTYKCATSFPL